MVLEKSPPYEAGGNSYYTAGAFRIAYDSLDDLVPLLDSTTVERLARTVVPPYPGSLFRGDMDRVTGGRCDPVLTSVLVSRSIGTLRWMRQIGLRFRLMYERQAYESDGSWVFFGGVPLGSVDGGRGLIAQHTSAAIASGVDIRYGATMSGLHTDRAGGVSGVTYRTGDAEVEIQARSVVLAAGGFEADPERRRRHLGDGWQDALVRGTPTNTGEVLDIAIAAGAAAAGDWSGCHSVAWDAGAPAGGGERRLTNQLTRQSYPLGIVVNTRGQRFVDEGADFRNFTYAKYGREILAQPGGRAFQLFDARTRPLLRTEEYDSEPITMATADTIEALALALGIDGDGLTKTVAEFNASIVDVPFDPAVKDGRMARVDPPKSNWAQALDSPPYYGYAVACGITFTFGGLKVDEEARVVGNEDRPLAGLYAAGEMVGGIFYDNYPGGTGLTSGAVFGQIAGEHAAGR
jgi:tricarballylate dehydrogenase